MAARSRPDPGRSHLSRVTTKWLWHELREVGHQDFPAVLRGCATNCANATLPGCLDMGTAISPARLPKVPFRVGEDRIEQGRVFAVPSRIRYFTLHPASSRSITGLRAASPAWLRSQRSGDTSMVR
jgi:hypothetical protein